jgi:hypothetical protein
MIADPEVSLPLHAIRALAKSGQTGQLVWSDESARIVVYLERGRIAWATSTYGRFSLWRELGERARTDQAALRVILDRCRASSEPFGEAIVRAGIATREAVRDVLQLQIADALGTLPLLSVQPTFVPRQPSYDLALTFDFDEVVRPARKRVRPVTRDFALPTAAVIEPTRRDDPMANLKDTLTRLMEIDGALGCCAVDSNSGMMLGSAGGGPVNLEVAAAGNTEVVRSKRKTMKALGLNDAIDDMLITLGRQYHIIRPLASNDALFIYLVLDRQRGNLAMARHQLAELEKQLSI